MESPVTTVLKSILYGNQLFYLCALAEIEQLGPAIAIAYCDYDNDTTLLDDYRPRKTVRNK